MYVPRTCGRAARDASIEVDQSEEKDLFDRVLPSALESAVSSGMAQLFDAIIIDEAQDLKEHGSKPYCCA